MKIIIRTLIAVTLVTIAVACSNEATTSDVSLSGELMKLHKVTLTFIGPNTSETARFNPFLDCSLNVTFTQGPVTHVIPGYYCANGEAGNTGAFPVTTYPAHVRDWKSGNPTWRNAKGKGIIGALNYLGAQRVNSVYFLPMNLGGDGQNTFPFASNSNDLVYDCSKLDQWGMVFDHAQENGILLHVVFNEAEPANRNWLDDGTLGTERKLFYREMIARFAHANGLKWMICEEHNPGFSTAMVKSLASYIRSADPYDHPIGIHNYQGWPIKYHVEDVFDGFLGDSNFDYLSIQYRPAQYGSATRYVDVIAHLRNDAWNAGRPLALMFDELERATTRDDESHDHSMGPSCPSGAQFLRKAVLWQIYLGVGGGVEWILEDLLSTHDFRSYEALWTYTRHALNFMDQIPVGDMVPGHHLLSGESKYTIPLYDIEGVVLTKPGEIYAVHLPDATNTGTLNLSGASGTFTKSWYNPRTGSFQGEELMVKAGGIVPLGTPPSSATDDWVVLIKKSAETDPT